MKRRQFLQTGAAAALSFAAFPSASARSDDHAPRLLIVMLRGGLDGLCAVPPVADADYERVRPTIAIRNALRLDASFALHPAMPHLHSLWAQGQLAVAHGAGFSYAGRSHFEGQDVMQSGMDKPYSSRTGWIGRAMQVAGAGGGVSISIPMPLILRGHDDVATHFPNWMPRVSASVAESLQALWGKDPVLAPYAGALSVQSSTEERSTMSSAQYAESRTLSELARVAGETLARRDGPRVGLIEFRNGFDTHANQGADQGDHADQLRRLDEVVRHFQGAMGAAWRHALVFTLTEFGRTVAENGTTGTDHGSASCCLLAGGLLGQSRVYADWRGLTKSSLLDGRDLPPTIDINAVHARIVQRVFGLSARSVQDEVLGFRDSSALKGLLV
jgi:uncharacterized protein (DUF1501 family)